MITQATRATAELTGPVPDADPLLVIADVAARYTESIEALHDVSLRINRGEIFGLVGANGAGKTTLMRAISNLLPAVRGRVTRGSISFEGHDVLRKASGDLVRLGLVPVLEGRHCFAGMTVEENLITGAIARGIRRSATQHDLDYVYTLFPQLAPKRRMPAGQVSGGEQQMTAIGRALMARPSLLVLDEPSMGLAPLAVQSIFKALSALNRNEQLTILFAEQNTRVARRYAHRIAVLTNGVSTEVDGLADDEVDRLYFGDSQLAL